MNLVVDASVACKWFVAEAGSQAAEALFAPDRVFFAPDLIVAEVCNLAVTKLRRGEIAAEQAASMVDRIGDFFDEIVPSAELARRAFAMANELAHPAYDCFYLALAERRNARLITADERFLERLSRTSWKSLADSLVAKKQTL